MRRYDLPSDAKTPWRTANVPETPTERLPWERYFRTPANPFVLGPLYPMQPTPLPFSTIFSPISEPSRPAARVSGGATAEETELTTLAQDSMAKYMLSPMRAETFGDAYFDSFQPYHFPAAYTLEGSILLTDHDVICDRGARGQYHAGNQILKNLIEQNRREYTTALKGEKQAVAARVIEEIKSREGRFLELSPSTGEWVLVEDARLVKMILNRFRRQPLKSPEYPSPMSTSTLLHEIDSLLAEEVQGPRQVNHKPAALLKTSESTSTPQAADALTEVNPLFDDEINHSRHANGAAVFLEENNSQKSDTKTQPLYGKFSTASLLDEKPSKRVKEAQATSPEDTEAPETEEAINNKILSLSQTANSSQSFRDEAAQPRNPKKRAPTEASTSKVPSKKSKSTPKTSTTYLKEEIQLFGVRVAIDKRGNYEARFKSKHLSKFPKFISSFGNKATAIAAGNFVANKLIGIEQSENPMGDFESAKKEALKVYKDSSLENISIKSEPNADTKRKKQDILGRSNVANSVQKMQQQSKASLVELSKSKSMPKKTTKKSSGNVRAVSSNSNDPFVEDNAVQVNAVKSGLYELRLKIPGLFSTLKRVGEFPKPDRAFAAGEYILKIVKKSGSSSDSPAKLKSAKDGAYKNAKKKALRKYKAVSKLKNTGQEGASPTGMGNSELELHTNDADDQLIVAALQSLMQEDAQTVDHL